MPKSKEKAPIEVNAQYVKSSSFNSPDAPKSLIGTKEKMDVEVGIDVNAHAVGKNIYEVDLIIRVHATREKDTVFTSDLVYSGMFTINEVENEEELRQLLFLYCPNLLFPYARKLVSDSIASGGFAPFMINPVDFAKICAQHLEVDKKSA